MCVLSIKVPIRKKSGNLFNDPCIFNFLKTFTGSFPKPKIKGCNVYNHSMYLFFSAFLCDILKTFSLYFLKEMSYSAKCIFFVFFYRLRLSGILLIFFLSLS